MSQEKVRVIVEVQGGCVSNVVAGDFVEVDILDWDNLLGDQGSPEETRDAWGELSPMTRLHIETQYPDAYKKIQKLILIANE